MNVLLLLSTFEFSFSGRLAQERHEEKKKLVLSDDEDNNKDSTDEENDESKVWGRMSNISLLDQHSELKKMAEAKKESAKEKQLKEEEKILRSVAETKALMGVAELAKGELWTFSLSLSLVLCLGIMKIPLISTSWLFCILQ